MPQYISSYVHGDGRVGVLVQLQCRDHPSMRTEEFKELARNLALQIAASRPLSLSPDDLPAEHWQTELHILNQRLSGLDAADREKCLNEMRHRFERDHCLLSQPFIKDDSITVEALIGRVSALLRDSIYVVRFVRYDASEI
jgi:elongation factor Ts